MVECIQAAYKRQENIRFFERQELRPPADNSPAATINTPVKTIIIYLYFKGLLVIWLELQLQERIRVRRGLPRLCTY
jgi:hypothetical protein